MTPPDTPRSLASPNDDTELDGRRSRLATGAVLVALVAIVVATTVFIARTNTQRSDLAVEARTASTIVSIEDRIAVYEEILYGVRSTFEITPSLDRVGFRNAIRRLEVDGRLPGVQVLGAAHLLRADDLPVREREIDEVASDSGLEYPPFEIYPTTEADHVLPIDYIEPQIGNEAAFGLDFLSEPNRRTAALTARDTGVPTATAPITLVQETATQKAILVMLPLYEAGVEPTTVEQRRAAFDGVVYAAFRIGDLLAGVFGDPGNDQLVVVDVGSDELLFGSDGAALDTADKHTADMDVAGQTWRLSIAADTQVLSNAARAAPFLTLVGGLLVAGLGVALMNSMRTARRRALGRATEKSNELDALSASASEGIVSVDESGAIVSWNAAASEIFGLSADEVIGTDGRSLVPDRSHEAFERLLAAAFDDEGLASPRHTVVASARRSNGDEFPAEISLNRWRATDQVYVTAFIRDVTERVRAEQQLIQTSSVLSGVLASATGVSIIGTDVDGVINVFSGGAERMLGHRASDMVGRTPVVLHKASEVIERATELGIDPDFEVFAASARGGLADTQTWTYVHADGHEIPVELSVTARSDARGQVIGFITVATDIRSRLADERMQLELLSHEREMVAKLQEVDRVKSDFVSTMSHELRTPLTSILGYTELLTDDAGVPAPEVAARMVTTIDKNAQRLLVLVEDLLALSKVESGDSISSFTRCDLAEIIASVSVALEPVATRGNVTIVSDSAPLPSVVGNPRQLDRVVMNLVSNAVKFSKPGGTVCIRTNVDDSVVIDVVDDGIGIPEDECDQVFGRFYRSRSAEELAIQGTGLGLSIVADIVERHGGTIALESTENVGTRVTVRLPLPGGSELPPSL